MKEYIAPKMNCIEIRAEESISTAIMCTVDPSCTTTISTALS